MKQDNIRTSGRPYHNQKDAEHFAVDYINKRGMVSQSVLEDEYGDWLNEMHENYEKDFDADLELVCGDGTERKNKCMENLSNHGVYEIDHDIVTINVREANRLGYKTPSGLKFNDKWFMKREHAKRMGYPIHDTVSWDKNANRLKGN